MAGTGYTACGSWLIVLLLSCGGNAQAQGWGGAIGYASDNVYRGVSLSSGRPAWLADLHYDFGDGWVAGIAGSHERPPFQSPGAQLTVYLDRQWQVDEDWSAKLGLVHYESPWNVWRDELNYNELTAAIGFRGRWRLNLALSPDTPGVFTAQGAPTGFAAAVELNFSTPLRGGLGANAGVGQAHLRAAGLDYTYASAGLSYRLGDVHLYASWLWATPGSLRYNTGASERARWVGTLLWTF